MDVEVQDDEVSVLDLLLVVADNLKLLAIGPLVAGLLALGIAFALPQTYTSVAYLKSGDGGKPIEAAMKTPKVLVDATSKWRPGNPIVIGSAEETKLLNKIRFKPALNQKTGAVLAEMEVDDESPQGAQALANALIVAWLESTKPQAQTKLEIERRLKLSRDALESVTKIIDRQTKESAAAVLPNLQYDVAASFVSLLQLRNGYVDSIAKLELELNGASNDIVFSSPTLPAEPASNKKALITVLSAVGTGFALLLFVFMRQAWRNAAQDPESAPKVTRLRAVLGRSA
jgi:uncharacterized protein involved in exopolysaccharide biosynthesis